MGSRFNRKWSLDIGIDLGTANTLIYLKGKGIVINEPSVVAIDKNTRQIISVGRAAKAMLGKAPKNVIVSRPLVDGVISDFELTEQLLKHFVQKVNRDYRAIWPKPKVVIGLPSGVTEVEKRAVSEAALSAGAGQVYLVEEPMAAAVGAGLPVMDATGSLIVDIGGGTTEIALIALGGIVISRSLRSAGDKLTEAITRYVRDDHNLAIGENSAEQIKIEVASLARENRPRSAAVRGRSLVSGLPQQVVVASNQLLPILLRQLRPTIDAIKSTLDESPPELVSDVAQGSIMLTGGGSQIKGLDNFLAHELKTPVKLVSSPLTTVAEGSGLILENFSDLRGLLLRGEGLDEV